MGTVVIINDYEIDTRIQITFSENDFSVVKSYWNQTDSLLQDLITWEPFVGRETWDDLDPTHWRVLIISNLTKMKNLSDSDRKDENNAVVKSLNFLICGLIICLEKRAECKIELMHINRVKEREVVYDFSAGLNMAIDLPTKKKKDSTFSVIVDNTDK